MGGITSSPQRDWGLHHQNSLEREREGEILYTLYTKWRALYVHKAYSLNMFYAQKHGLVEAGKRGSRQHSTHRVWVEMCVCIGFKYRTDA